RDHRCRCAADRLLHRPVQRGRRGLHRPQGRDRAFDPAERRVGDRPRRAPGVLAARPQRQGRARWRPAAGAAAAGRRQLGDRDPVKLIVTGAAGILGHAVLAAARAAGPDVTALTRAELDLTDGAQTVAAIGALRPEAVINCAAYTDVDGAETDEAAADAGNAAAPANLAAACD